MKNPVFIFDMSGVLLDFDLDAIKQRVAQDSDLTFDEVNRSWKNERYIQSELGQISSESYFKGYSEDIGLKWDYQKWITEWSNICTYNKNGMKLFNFLCQQKYPIYVLSNLAEYHKIAVEQKFPDFWKASNNNFFSYNLGLLKPDPEIFIKVCSNINTSPLGCFFFDDTAENVTKANEVGLNALQFSETNFSSIVQYLKNSNIEIYLN